MADVRISPVDWRHLKKRALFFVPPLIRYQALYDISNVEISNASRELGIPLSAQVVGAMTRLAPVTYNKAVSTVNALNDVAKRKHLNAQILRDEVIAAVFILMNHKDVITNIGITEEEVEKFIVKHGVSRKIVQNAYRGGRINLHVAKTMHKVFRYYGYAGNITDLITSDAKRGVCSIWKDENDVPMVEFDDLKKAGANDHPWRL